MKNKLIDLINLTGNNISFLEDMIKGYSMQSSAQSTVRSYKRELAKEQGLFKRLREELKELEELEKC